MKANTFIKILTVFFAALCLFLSVYFLCFEKVYIIEDPTFETLYPKKALRQFRNVLVLKGKQLRTVKLEYHILEDSENLELEFEKYSSAKTVILSPVVCASVKHFGFNVSDALESTKVIALGSVRNSYFDTCLSADSEDIHAFAPEDVSVLENGQIKNFEYEDSTSYAVDYRFSKALDPHRIKGVFAPDLVMSVLPLIDFEKEQLPAQGILVYGYYGL